MTSCTAFRQDKTMNSAPLIRRKNKIVLPDAPGVTNPGIVAAANLNLQNLGYTLSAAAIRQIRKTDSRVSTLALAEVLQFATQAKGDGAGLANPMYPNFPSQVATAAEGELYLNALLHYFSVFVSDVTGGNSEIYFPQYYKDPRRGLVETNKIKLTVLDVADAKQVFTLYREAVNELVTSNTSVSAQDKQDIQTMV